MTRLVPLTIMLLACVARAGQDLPAPERIAIGRGCSGLRAADFNGDGRQDLLVFAGSQRLLVIANGPDGFGAPIDTTGIGTLGDAGDLNGDGLADVVTGRPYDDAVSVMRNLGDGLLAAPVRYEFFLKEAQAIRLGDMDGDGDLDIVASLERGELAVMLNDGEGNFSSITRYPIEFDSTQIELADFDGDGDLDCIRLAPARGRIVLVPNQGAGVMGPETILATECEIEEMAVADVTGDGWPDVVATSGYIVHPSCGSGTVAIFENDRAGGLGTRTGYSVYILDSHAVAAGDVDGDGRADLVTANFFSDEVGTLLATGDGDFVVGGRYATGSRPVAVLTEDFDGDGVAEVAVATNTEQSEVLVFDARGGAHLAGFESLNGGQVEVGRAVAAGDISGNGLADIVVADHLDRLLVSRNLGDANFAVARAVDIGRGAAGIAIGDLDGDGRGDIAVANEISDDVSVVFVRGGGTLLDEVRLPLGNGPRGVAIGDLTGDGLGDLAVACVSSNDVRVLVNLGDRRFEELPPVAVGIRPWDIALADLDGDGDLDAAVVNEFNDDASILLNDGAGAFAEAGRYPVGDRPHGVALADADGDGRPDLYAVNEADGTIAILKNLGGGVFGEPSPTPTVPRPQRLRVADLNGDGLPEAVVVGREENTLGLHVGVRGEPAPGTLYRQVANRVPADADLGDIDGDGVPDVAMAYEASDRGQSFLTRLPRICRVDVDGDGALTLFDFLAFQTSFDAGDPVADFDGDGVLTIFDFLAFQTAFDAGC
ncbi:MAG: VCBS repeat-containing protein [Phycisphaerales bacterium]